MAYKSKFTGAEIDTYIDIIAKRTINDDVALKLATTSETGAVGSLTQDDIIYLCSLPQGTLFSPKYPNLTFTLIGGYSDYDAVDLGIFSYYESGGTKMVINYMILHIGVYDGVVKGSISISSQSLDATKIDLQ